MAGDFNTTLEPHGHLVGRTRREATGCGATGSVPVSGSCERPSTFVEREALEAGHGTATQLDYIFTRAQVADSEARLATAAWHVQLASWRKGGRHLSIVARIPIKSPWCRNPAGEKVGGQVNTEAMLADAKQAAERHAEYLNTVQQALTRIDRPDWLQIDVVLRKVSEAMYPAKQVEFRKQWHEAPVVELALRDVWSTRRQLIAHQKYMYLNLREMLHHWRLAARLQRHTKQLRRQSNLQRRAKWHKQLQDAMRRRL